MKCICGNRKEGDTIAAGCPVHDQAEDRLTSLVMFRPELIKLMVFCEQKLRENEHKGHWSNCEMSYLTKRLHDEFAELKRAIDKKASQETIFRECSDIANFAMMIADSYNPDIDCECDLNDPDAWHIQEGKEK